MKARRTCSCTTPTSPARASSRSPKVRGSRSSLARARRARKRPTSLRSYSSCVRTPPPGRAGSSFYRTETMGEKEEKIELEGEVVEALRGQMFRIELDNGHETLGYVAG